ncbi:MAG: SurA N-terminal domain-containing protein [Candidatus Omnitrophica bacterium]|nr:SurA N-terminal domain-containing protein [Candidatus Omnitrophota bacterium]
MFKILRKNTKIVIWIIVLAFGIWGAGTLAVSRKKSASYAGSVFGDPVSYRQFEMTNKMVHYLLEKQLRQKDGSLPDLPGDYFTKATFEELALLHEAKRKKIKVSDDEVRQALRGFIGVEGAINENAYTDWVTRTFREQPRNFEEALRDVIRTRKLLRTVTDDITVTNEEVEKAYFSEKKSYNFLSVLFSFDEAEKTMPLPELIQEDKKAEYIKRNVQSYTREKANNWLVKIKDEGLGSEAAALKEGLAVENTGLLKSADDFEKAGIAKNEIATLKTLGLNDISLPILTDKGYRLLCVKEIKEATKEDFEKEKESFWTELMARKKNEALQKFLVSFLKEAKIQSYLEREESPSE